MPLVVRPTFPITVADDPRLCRYELLVGGDLAATANYVLGPSRIIFSYSELMPGFEGRGLGNQLAKAVLDDVRQRGLAAWERGVPADAEPGAVDRRLEG